MEIFARLTIFFALGIAALLVLAFAFKILFAAVVLAGLTFAGVLVYTAIRRLWGRRQATLPTRPY
jgi:membrane protein implicated in regulation of membrane protease activity